jgi:HK97 gp10 family phage protein
MQAQITIKGDLAKKIAYITKHEPFAVKKAVSRATLFMWSKASKNTPKWRGELRKAMSYKTEGFQGVVANRLEYAEGVHEGTEPHWVPMKVWKDDNSSFSKWATEHGIPPFLLARSIAAKGTKGQPWFKETVKDHQKRVWEIFEEEINKTMKKKV